MIDLNKLWDIMRQELCATGKDAKCIVLLRKDALKKVVKRYNMEISSESKGTD